MARQSWVVVALVVVLVALVEAQLCEPSFDPKVDCRSKAAPGWVHFSGMGYKYFPTPKTQKEATKACKPYDELICSARRGWQSYLVSLLTEGELEGGILAAYEDSCITNGPLFWTGVKRSSKGKKLYYEDSSNSSSDKNRFDNGIPKLRSSQCVAINGDTGKMEVVSCSIELPYMCKIMPTGGH